MDQCVTADSTSDSTQTPVGFSSLSLVFSCVCVRLFECTKCLLGSLQVFCVLVPVVLQKGRNCLENGENSLRVLIKLCGLSALSKKKKSMARMGLCACSVNFFTKIESDKQNTLIGESGKKKYLVNLSY